MKSKYFEAITSLRKAYPVEQLCKAFGVSKSGYYAYLKRPVRPISTRDLKDRKAIQDLYNTSRGTIGAKVLQAH